MSRLTVYYLTGTGNSLLASRWIAAAARAAGLEARLESIAPARDPAGGAATPADVLALCFPTHAFTAPWAMIRFALGLPMGNGRSALVLVTRGSIEVGRVLIPGLEGTAGYLIAGILRAKGYDVLGVRGVDMPSNWTIVHSAMGDEPTSRIIGRAEREVAGFTHDVLAGQSRHEGQVRLALGLALAPVSLLYNLVGRFKLAKLFFASSACNSCGVCARECPHHAIRMHGHPPRPFWTYDCEGCMRCRSYCPNQAIETSYSFGALASFLTGSSALAFLLGQAARRAPAIGALGRGWQGKAASYTYGLVAMAIVYRVFHVAIRVPLVNRFFALTTPTTRFRRYQAPGVSVADLRGE
jgi:Pyruvate/2-oxoacid:ferredoxin oxidoreductase delta subunit